MTILDVEYWPSLSWMHQLYVSKEVVLQTEANYQKQSLFNRCHIVGKDGPLTLSVPLFGGREQKAKIKDLQIDNTQRWAIRQIRTLKSCYGKAPYFEYYFPVIESILLQPHQQLLEMNYQILVQLAKWLQWKGNIQKAEEYNTADKKSKSNFHLKPYLQVFAGSVSFVPNLSVIDGLFCMGPSLKDYLVD